MKKMKLVISFFDRRVSPFKCQVVYISLKNKHYSDVVHELTSCTRMTW